MDKIRFIHAIAAFSFGINNVNRGEDGIQKLIPQLNRSYISGDKIIFCVTETVRNLNNNDPNKNQTYLSTGDKRSNDIENDIASDLNGYMLPKKKDIGDTATRNGIIGTTSVLSLNPRNEVFNFKMKFSTDNTSHMPINETLSISDTYVIPFKINKIADISYDLNKKTYVNNENERKRRINLYLNGFINLQGLACQHNAMVNNMATYVKYIISSTENIPILSLNQYSNADLMRYNNNLKLIDYQVKKENAVVFEGGINPLNNEQCEMNVIEAMEAAQNFIIEHQLDSYD